MQSLRLQPDQHNSGAPQPSRCSAQPEPMAKTVTLSALGGLLGASYLGAFVGTPGSPAPAPALRGTATASAGSGHGAAPVTGAAATAVATAAVALVASRKSKKTSSAWLGKFMEGG